MRNGDLIIDCFAGGGGASVGIEEAVGRSVDIAVNHDPEAIRMHKVNHPGAIHLTEDIFSVNLRRYVGKKKVALMWASPDCTSHSKAKGGQPRISGLRMLPWAVYKHAKDIRPAVIIMENVEEYAIADVFLRMLKPEELKILQGFPEDYIIDHDIDWKPYPIKEQVARIGNSVVPIMAREIVSANCGYLKVGERVPNLRIHGTGQLAFV